MCFRMDEDAISLFASPGGLAPGSPEPEVDKPETPGRTVRRQTQKRVKGWKKLKKGEFECLVTGCRGGKFASKFTIKRHWQNCHVKQIKKYRCPAKMCRLSFSTVHDTNRHCHSLHGGCGKGTRFAEIFQNNKHYQSPKQCFGPSSSKKGRPLSLASSASAENIPALPSDGSYSDQLRSEPAYQPSTEPALAVQQLLPPQAPSVQQFLPP